MAPRETENNAYAKFLGDKQRALWYVMVFFRSGQLQLPTGTAIIAYKHQPIHDDAQAMALEH